LAAILFGILTFVSPASSLFALVLLFGAYALADGVLALVMLAERRKGVSEDRPWGWLVFEGLVSIAAGLVTFFWPGITAVVLLVCIAAWAIAHGIAEIAMAIRLRKVLKGEWLLALSGALSIAFGVLLFARPGAGALVVTLWIGAYAVIFGALLVGLSFRLRAWGQREEHRIPPGGISVTA
jgi:uncharacterized membrane protein HdeD (DUF308 family)